MGDQTERIVVPETKAERASRFEREYAFTSEDAARIEKQLQGEPDTPDIPETDFTNAVVGKFYMGKADVKHYDLMSIRPFLKTLNARLTRKRYSETPVREYLQQIQPVELAEQYLEFYDAHPAYRTVCAGAKHHHWWEGGLEDHVREMIGMGLDMMDLYPGDMVFTKSDFIIACFLHDFNKIWIYRKITPEIREKNPKKFHEKQVFTYANDGRAEIMDGYSMILLELAKAGIVPSDIQWSAVLFHESAFSPAGWQYGGPSKTMDTINTRNLLAVMVNMADMYSSHFLGKSLV